MTSLGVHLRYLILILIALSLACGPVPHQNEAHVTVMAYSVNQWGGRQLIDYWSNCTRPVKQGDGTFKFYNHFSERTITVPAGTEFVIEEGQ